MNFKSLSFYTFCSLFFFTLFGAFSSLKPLEECHLERILCLNKEVYLVYEPIWAISYAKNTGSEAERYHPSEASHFIIRDTSGNEVEYQGPMLHYPVIVDSETHEILGYADSHELLPGDSSGVLTRNILDYYGVGKGLASKTRLYIPPSRYTVEATPMKSNVVHFTVLEPTGEEKEAHELLLKAYACGRGKVEGQKAIDFYKQIVVEYPNSAYAPIAFDRAIMMYSFALEDRNEVIKQTRMFIDTYPNSFFMKSAVNRIVYNYLFSGEIDKIKPDMEAIQEKHRDSRVKKIANDVIKQVEEGEFQRELEELRKAGKVD